MIKLAAIATATILAIGGSVAAVTAGIGDGACTGTGGNPAKQQGEATIPGDDDTGADKNPGDEPPDVDVRALRAPHRAFSTDVDDTPAETDAATDEPTEAGDADVQVGGGPTSCAGNGLGGSAWKAGNIISDDVFYNANAMNEEAIAAFLADKGAACQSNCLKDLAIDTTTQPADAYCDTYIGGVGQPIARVFADVARVCGINPQVLLVMLEKESSLVTATSPADSRYQAAFGFACPDAGPGGSAACSSASSGMWAQTWGAAHLLAKYRVEIPKGNIGRYQPGMTVDILWNVAESGCGAAPVTIENVATASLYTYTPYQPNQAAIDSYPGTGDECSSYGNRNFFFLFQEWFGSTGGGAPDGTGASDGQFGPTAVTVGGVTVVIPQASTVPAALVGRRVIAPTPQVAQAIAAGMTWLGSDYSWGGGGANGPTLGICTDGAAANDCHVVGFDCSGLTSYVAARFGAHLPRLSGDQRDPAHGVAWSQALPGDLVGYDGHIAIYLGQFDGVGYTLEAPQSGKDIQIHAVKSGADAVVYRYWADPSAA